MEFLDCGPADFQDRKFVIHSEDVIAVDSSEMREFGEEGKELDAFSKLILISDDPQFL